MREAIFFSAYTGAGHLPACFAPTWLYAAQVHATKKRKPHFCGPRIMKLRYILLFHYIFYQTDTHATLLVIAIRIQDSDSERKSICFG